MNKAKTTASNAFTKPLGNYTVSVDDLAQKASANLWQYSQNKK
jgi:hypothetical protein